MPVTRKIARRTTAKPVARAGATRTKAAPVTKTAVRTPHTRGKVTPNKPGKAKSVREVAKPTAKKTETKARAPRNLDKDPSTGFVVGTDMHVIASEMLKGAADRQEIIDRCRDLLPKESRNGTTKAVSNLVATTLGRMKDAGFTIDSHWILQPPTRASKAKATRERNRREAEREAAAATAPRARASKARAKR